MGERSDGKGITGDFTGLDPDLDLEAHRGKPIYIGKNLADARFVGHVGGNPVESAGEEPKSGV